MIFENGIVNAASYNIASTSVAPGSIATIFGSNLSNGTVCVTPCGPTFDKNGVLVPTLSGASVTFNAIPAPVLAVPSTGQISVQVPVEMAGSASASVIVTVNGQSSSPVKVPISAAAPGLFALNASGSGLGAILNATDANSGVVSLPSPWFDFPNSHPAPQGSVIVLYATGLGAMSPNVATGTRPVGTPRTATLPAVTIGGVPATVQFSGQTSCCVGLNQINVTVPAGALTGANDTNHVPVVLSIDGQTSNTVTIAVGFPLAGISGTATTLSGAINNSNIQYLGLDLAPPATMTGSYAVSGTGVSSGGQIVYSVSGSGSGTISSCVIAGTTGSGNWTASGTMTITAKPEAAGAPPLLGSFTASTTFTVCGKTIPTRIANGGILGSMNPAGAVILNPVRTGGGTLYWPLTGTVEGGVFGLIGTGGGIWNDPTQITGGVNVTSQPLAGSDTSSVYTLTGSGSGVIPCGDVLRGGTGTGPWNISVSSTLTLSPPPASLVTSGGSVSGTYARFLGTGSVCGVPLSDPTGQAEAPIVWQGGKIVGTVFPGGGITLSIIPDGSGTGP